MVQLLICGSFGNSEKESVLLVRLALFRNFHFNCKMHRKYSPKGFTRQKWDEKKNSYLQSSKTKINSQCMALAVISLWLSTTAHSASPCFPKWAKTEGFVQWLLSACNRPLPYCFKVAALGYLRAEESKRRSRGLTGSLFCLVLKNTIFKHFKCNFKV